MSQPATEEAIAAMLCPLSWPSYKSQALKSIIQGVYRACTEKSMVICTEFLKTLQFTG